MWGEERNVTVVTLYAATEVTQSLRPQDLTNIFKQFISAKPLIDHSEAFTRPLRARQKTNPHGNSGGSFLLRGKSLGCLENNTAIKNSL